MSDIKIRPYDFKTMEREYVTIKLRPNAFENPGKPCRCINCGIIIANYFGYKVDYIFEGRVAEAIMGLDVMCGRCKTIFRFVI